MMKVPMQNPFTGLGHLVRPRREHRAAARVAWALLVTALAAGACAQGGGSKRDSSDAQVSAERKDMMKQNYKVNGAEVSQADFEARKRELVISDRFESEGSLVRVTNPDTPPQSGYVQVYRAHDKKTKKSATYSEERFEDQVTFEIKDR